MAPTVLIVDDSLTVRMNLHEAFTAGGFRTLLCATGAQARAALVAETVDAAVLDVQLPDADGVELLGDLRGDPRHADAVVMMLSSEAEVSDRLRGLRSGADEYVGKPYDVGYVVSRAHQLLRSRSAATDERTSVLVVDDSATFREQLRAVLEGHGYQVVSAANGEQGLRMAADRPPSAIVVDSVMPGIDGATVIRRIRLDPALRDVPCLLLTAADDHSTELAALEAGADAFAHKREDFSVVLAQLAVLLRGSAEAMPITRAGSVHGPTKVLAVDADRARLTALGDVLRADGHEVVLAAGQTDAMALLSAQSVDCVVLDVDVVGADCAQTVRRIRAVPSLRELPMVVTGGGEHHDALLNCLAAGADHYLARSEGLEVLRAHVRGQIRRKQAQDENRRIRDELLEGQLKAVEARAAGELAETRAALVEELEWRNQELDAFNGSVSHDLRGPLQLAIAHSEMLLEDELDRLSEQGQDQLRRIHAAVRRMSDLVDALMLLCRASRDNLERRETDLSAVAREVVEEMRRREPHRAVAVTVREGMTALGDANLLRIVLENLIGNAWKFTRHTEHPQVEVGSVARGQGRAFFVRDNGAGFAAGEAEQLFRPFHRLHSQEEFPGTGIGLTTVHRIVDRHGGRIWAEGATGQGATFTFTLAPTDGPD